MNKLIIAILVLFPVVLTSCSEKDNPPTTNELKNALILYLPAHIEVKSFTVQASQNLGNKVEPLYGSRFKATIEIIADLYAVDKTINKAIFVRLNTLKGTQTEIFGKIKTQLYQGALKYNFDIDGNPTDNLGKPLNQISGGNIIIRGSDEEKKFIAELKEETEQLAGKKAQPTSLITGKVLEYVTAGGYTYINVATDSGEKWIAVNQVAIEVGEEVTYMDGMVMQNFFSKSLDRTFPEILFSSGLVRQ